jgi:hypothetical protein
LPAKNILAAKLESQRYGPHVEAVEVVQPGPRRRGRRLRLLRICSRRGHLSIRRYRLAPLQHRALRKNIANRPAETVGVWPQRAALVGTSLQSLSLVSDLPIRSIAKCENMHKLRRSERINSRTSALSDRAVGST